ncbi:MAG TPA: hypothetical protein DHW82_00880 [Spirochaetia bacterium]|nr:MAG: hypothetical protein A2Y41_07980 [Spirochaetes bacterium GWB1_36_13]HCL55552.1 hypothetical protein [Spirochaetia bacterium]
MTDSPEKSEYIDLIFEFQKEFQVQRRGFLLTRLYEKFKNLIWAVVWERLGACFGQVQNKTNCRDDLYQEGYFGFEKALESFDREKQVKFSTFAFHVILNRLKKYCARKCRRWEKYREDNQDILENKEYVETFGDKKHLHEIQRYFNEQKNLKTSLKDDFLIEQIFEKKFDLETIIEYCVHEKEALHFIFKNLLHAIQSLNIMDIALIKLVIIGKTNPEKMKLISEGEIKTLIEKNPLFEKYFSLQDYSEGLENDKIQEKISGFLVYAGYEDHLDHPSREELCDILSMTRGKLDYQLDKIAKKIGCRLLNLSRLNDFKKMFIEKFYINGGLL